MENFFPLNNDYILEDSNNFFNPMAKMFMPATQTIFYVDMLTCSDKVQPSTASFIASRRLQTEANSHPTEIPLHSVSSSENPHFVQQNTGTLAAYQPHLPLYRMKRWLK